MIRPTTIPETIDELVVEHAVAREALRLGFKHHKSLARGLRGVQRRRTVADIFEQTMDLESYIDMMKINLIAGTGGLLSRAPWRAQAALILIDGFQPEGITLLAQDSIFMIPHLGLLSTVHPTAALEIFEKDCLIKLGTCIAPKSPETVKGSEVMVVTMRMPDGSERTETLNLGQLKRIPLKEGEKAQLQVRPTGDYDVGAGPGRQHEVEVEGGIVGIVLDARGRPIVLPESRSELRTKVLEWYSALEAYPVESLEGWKQRT